MIRPAGYLEAARVSDSVPLGIFGPWTLSRHATHPDLVGMVGWPSMTVLHRPTWATLHRTIGEVVMEDSRSELQRHMPIWLAARGRVLITGLGLGCVVRGLLANPGVEHIDVVELCPHIIRAIAPEFAGDGRVTIHHHDALTWPVAPGARWDFAWHDIWVEGDDLQVLHAELIKRFWDHCPRQGAWAFPRWVGRRLAGAGIQLLGQPRSRRRA